MKLTTVICLWSKPQRVWPVVSSAGYWTPILYIPAHPVVSVDCHNLILQRHMCIHCLTWYNCNIEFPSAFPVLNNEHKTLLTHSIIHSSFRIVVVTSSDFTVAIAVIIISIISDRVSVVVFFIKTTRKRDTNIIYTVVVVNNNSNNNSNSNTYTISLSLTTLVMTVLLSCKCGLLLCNFAALLSLCYPTHCLIAYQQQFYFYHRKQNLFSR